MADLTEEQLRQAEARGREMLEAEPRATVAHYDPAAGRVVIELANGCGYAFPVQRVQDLQGASDEDLADVEVDGAGFNLHWPKLDVDLYVPALVAGVFGTRAWIARVGSRRRPGEIAREGGGGPLERGQRGAAAQGGKGLTITRCTTSVRRSRPRRMFSRGDWASFWPDVDQWRPG